jgi:Na+/proline symporter
MVQSKKITNEHLCCIGFDWLVVYYLAVGAYAGRRSNIDDFFVAGREHPLPVLARWWPA